MSDVVRFERVVWSGEDGARVNIPDLAVSSGGLAVVHLPAREETAVPVCDLACGVLVPDSGTVRFMGRSWQERRPPAQSRLRSRIGRVFEGCAWVSNLSVRENVILQQLHSGKRSGTDLEQDMQRLAVAFGMDGIPAGRPESLRPHDLIRMQWVRAFLGHPGLFLLEEPERDAWEEHARLLRQRTLDATAAGAAAIWVTRRRDAWRDERATCVRHAAVTGDRLIWESEGA
jgi:ABC-type lipoprotein export system ATPase subunit